ncbi:MAG: hypothetical protein AAFQ94_19735 [Bacteroidota bacterium]
MKKSKIKLSDLKVSSFRTDAKNVEDIKGGRWSIGGAGACPHTGEQSLDYLGCNSIDDFWCRNQSDGYVSACSADPFICDSPGFG